MRARPTFDALVDEHQSMIARICASYESDRELARELVQDVLFAIWRALPGYREECSLKTFVARIAQFRAISHVEARVKRPAFTELPDEIAAGDLQPDGRVIASDKRNRVLLAVRELPIAYRDPVILTLEDFTPSEIADVLGLSPNVISIRLTRARAMLRTLLGESTS